MQKFLEHKREEIAALCRTHHVRRLAVFGSAVRDDFDPERSDVDVIVDFEPELLHSSGYIRNLSSLEEDLVRLFGRDVNILREGVVRNPFLLRNIRRDQRELYAA